MNDMLNIVDFCIGCMILSIFIDFNFYHKQYDKMLFINVLKNKNKYELRSTIFISSDLVRVLTCNN